MGCWAAFLLSPFFKTILFSELERKGSEDLKISLKQHFFKHGIKIDSILSNI
jgi:hypothetical protein